MKPARFLEEADLEFQEAISFFEGQVEGLGNSFVSEVEAVVQRLREYPNAGSFISKNVRKALLRRFPYSVLYAVEPEELVVIAVAHHKRRPGYWRKRLS